MNDRFHHLFITPGDFDRSVAFYRDVLGWTITDTWGGNGAGRGVVISGGGMKVVLGEKSVPPAADSATPTVHLDIHDIESRFRALPKGKHVVVPPQDTHWGTRWFVVRDPDGNLIAFEELHPRGG